jgi:aspartyl-tRNA(Asn)/glutamyl-tRNA(Gln) amidotransferase subunit B
LVDAGEPVIQQTRSFDADTDTTFAIRDKEDANDYRYFPDPDLSPFHLTDAVLKEIEAEMPALPNALLQQLQTVYGLNAYDAAQVSEEKAHADYFLAATQHTKQYKAIANWMMGPLKQLPNQQILAPKRLAELIELVESGAVNFSIAAQKLLPLLLQEDGNPAELARQHQLIQVQDNQQLANWVNLVLANMPEKVAEYKKGKKGLIGLFVGEVKKLSKGQADPKLVTQLLEEKLTQ